MNDDELANFRIAYSKLPDEVKSASHQTITKYYPPSFGTGTNLPSLGVPQNIWYNPQTGTLTSGTVSSQAVSNTQSRKDRLREELDLSKKRVNAIKDEIESLSNRIEKLGDDLDLEEVKTAKLAEKLTEYDEI